jgi:hypothetical protein
MQRVCRTYDGPRYRLIHWKVKAVWSDLADTGLVLPGQFARQMVTNEPTNDIFRQTNHLHGAFPEPTLPCQQTALVPVMFAWLEM